MKQYSFLICIFFVIYTLLIFSKAIKYLKINDIFYILSKNVKSIQTDIKNAPYYDDHISEYQLERYFSDHKNRNKLLNMIKQMPRLFDLGIHGYRMDYTLDFSANMLNAEYLIKQLLSIRDFAGHDLKKSLNPFYTVAFIFETPNRLVRFMGLKNNSKLFVFLINIIGWGFVYFLNMFSPEIKVMIQKILK